MDTWLQKLDFVSFELLQHFATFCTKVFEHWSIAGLKAAKKTTSVVWYVNGRWNECSERSRLYSEYRFCSNSYWNSMGTVMLTLTLTSWHSDLLCFSESAAWRERSTERSIFRNNQWEWIEVSHNAQEVPCCGIRRAAFTPISVWNLRHNWNRSVWRYVTFGVVRHLKQTCTFAYSTLRVRFPSDARCRYHTSTSNALFILPFERTDEIQLDEKVVALALSE